MPQERSAPQARLQYPQPLRYPVCAQCPQVVQEEEMNNKPAKKKRTYLEEKTLAFKVGTIAVAILSVIVVLYVLRYTFGVRF